MSLTSIDLLAEALKRCDSEPIQFIGSIQGDGVLIALNEASLVCAASANLAEIFEISPERAMGLKASRVIGSESWQTITALGPLAQNRPPIPVILAIERVASLQYQQAFVHQSGPYLVIEVESLERGNSVRQIQFDATARALNALLADTPDVASYAGQLARHVRSLTGFDRVMVYQFDPQWNGRVIAESCDYRMGTFLDHHFPAADIPEPARQLYAKNLVRILADRDALPVPLIQAALGADAPALDLSFSVLRSMSPVHLVYLRNMDVAASVSISLLQHGRLWGLVVCHHRAPRRLPLMLRDSLELVARTAAVRLSALAFDTSLNYQARLRAAHHDLQVWAQNTTDLAALMPALQRQLLGLVRSTGLAIVTEKKTTCFGETPPNSALADLVQWLVERLGVEGSYSCHKLAAQYPPGADFCELGAGLLAIKLDESGKHLAVWFRAEVVRSITWAGDKAKVVTEDAYGPRLEPRSSFARWVQIRQGESEPWTAPQIDAARTLSMTLGQLLARQRLVQSEQRYRSLIDWSIQALVVQRDGVFLYVNPAAVKLFGARSERDLVGRPMLERVHPEYRQRMLMHSKSALDEGVETALSEEKFLKLDGSIIDVEFKGIGVTFDGTSANQVTLRDITETKLVMDQLRVSAQVLKSISQGVLIATANGSVVSSNDAFERMTGYATADILGLDFSFLQGPLTDPAILAVMRETLALGAEFNGELLNYRKDGSSFWNEMTISPLRNVTGELTHFVGVTRDITQRKQAQGKMLQAASVFTHAREGITIADANGCILDVNDTFTQITGYSRDEVLGQNPRILNSGRQGPEFYANMWADLLDKGHWQGEIWNRKKSGEIYPEILTISAVRDETGKAQHYVALFTDISAIKAHESELEYVAHYDMLTGLPNRVLLGDRLAQAMLQARRRDQRLAVVYLDLDSFKAINDTYGHSVGDQLLKTVGQKIKQTLREGDTLAHLGADEFVVVLNDLADVSVSEPMIKRVLAAVAEPLRVEEHLLTLSASLGVTFYPQTQVADADLLLRQADQAMYLAKQAGKNRFHVFDAEHDRSVRDHHQRLARLTQALRQREFVLYYQPKVNMRTGAVIGAEALIRWQHPEQGLLAPLTFLPDMENHPLAIEVGEWVIDSALQQLQAWQAVGLNLTVSVNVGASQLQQSIFVERLGQMLAAYPMVNSSSLEIEVLETSALHDLDRVAGIMLQCCALGVSFSLDDFGTGYSSLTYLKRLPVRVLKIDQSFVRDMLDDSDDLSILRGIIGLAQTFHREVIAEGVETMAHGIKLLQLGCERGQGFGIARPMPAADLPNWAAQWRVTPVLVTAD
jgi:diguanylate cyclase (GGDEF)-like protein/PAS domain S-box-containing protein